MKPLQIAVWVLTLAAGLFVAEVCRLSQAQQSTTPADQPAPGGQPRSARSGHSGRTACGCRSCREGAAIGQERKLQSYATGPSTGVLPLTVPQDRPRGKVTMFSMKSEDTKVYPGVRGPYTRNVWVYVPGGMLREKSCH